MKNRENDQMTAITPLGQKIAQCYSHSLLYVSNNVFSVELLTSDGSVVSGVDYEPASCVKEISKV